MWSPVVNGLHIGQLVEIVESDISTGDGGNLGQLDRYDPDTDKFGVSMISTGEYVDVDIKNVLAAPQLSKPGEGGGEDSFDLVIGPQTQRGVLGEELAAALEEKGFCVIKVIQTEQDRNDACDALREADAEGKFGRLAEEVEEGYLGKGGRAKVMWLDPDSAGTLSDTGVGKNDDMLTSIAEVLQPYCEDCLTCPIAERTPALLCMSMTEDDEAEYENPVATNSVIEEFYSVWCRSVARLIHFMGPEKGWITLVRKDTAPVTEAQDVTVGASPNTIIVFREDTFEYTYEEPTEGESCWLQSFLLKPGAQFELSGDFEGNVDLLQDVAEGPPPPTQDVCTVCAFGIQAAGGMRDHHTEWIMYTAGTDAHLEMPLARFDYRPYYSEEVDFPQGTTYVKHFSVQEGIEMFDNKIFEVSNNESEAMDPMCRQTLEVGYLCMIKIGYTKKWCNTHPTHASVSVGCDKNEWLSMPNVPRSVATNNQLAIQANRFSYVFNLKGGSFVVDTACSSSLVAGHLGKMNMFEQRWDPIAFHLGFGTGLTLGVGSFIGSGAAHMLSPKGRCFTFNSTADGYNRGDGTAGMLLKVGENPDERYAWFRGSQIGQDGRSASLSAPNGPAQEKCTWGALREARMTPPESTVWECHGTGTSLGDPIEVGAVRKVQVKMARKEPLMIASSKSNIGHLEGSAAAAGMNKCIMIVIKANCAPNVHLKTLNPHLDHAAFDAFFCSEQNPYRYRRGHAQVSSFGVGGTNGHAIFYGENLSSVITDTTKQFLKRLAKLPPPIIFDGNNPADWEYNGVDYNAKPGDRYEVIIEKDNITGEETLRYEKQEEGDIIRPEYYSTSGNHNDWTDDRMMEGDVPDLFYQDVEMPDEGKLEFRLWVEGDADQAIGPETEGCTRRTSAIVGPEKGNTGFWKVVGEAGSFIRIEFLAPLKGPRSITWFKVE